jgi:hypothetical protein
MSWPTSRRYPRTLREAFPHDARHAYAIERVASRRMQSVGGALVIIALVLTLASTLVSWAAA